MTAYVPRRHEADTGLMPDDDGAELRKDLHALIDRFTTSAGERRQTVRAHEKARKSGLGSLGFLGPSGFLRALGIAESIAVPFDRDNLGMVREPIDQGDGAGGIGKDRVPLLEG